MATVPNYTLIRHDRQTVRPDGTVKSGGGLGIYHRDSLDVNPDEFAHLNVSNPTIEVQWVVITRPHTKRILLGNVYRPPDGNLTEALELLNDALDQIASLARMELILLGDFNADVSTKGTPVAQKIKQFEAEQQLQQLILSPTRFSAKGHTTIDLAFSNIKYCSDAGTINYNISDHKLIYLIKKKPRNCKAVETHMGRSYVNCTHDNMIESFEDLDTRHIYQITDPNECWKAMEKLVLGVADKLCPIKALKIRVNSVKYLNNALLELQRDREYFAEKADLTSDLGDLFIAKCVATKARIEVDRARASHYKVLALVLDQNSKKYWDTIEEIEPKANAKINGIVDDATGEKIPIPDLPERVNDFLSTIGAKLTSKFPTIPENQKRFIPKTNPIKFDIKTVNKYDLMFKLEETDLTKSSGMTNISTTFFNKAMLLLINEFTHGAKRRYLPG